MGEMTSVFNSPRRQDDSQTLREPLVHWRGPNGDALLFWEVDFRPGGASRLCLRSPDGHDYWVEGVFLEIVEPERVVFAGTLEAEGCLTERPGTVTFRRTERGEEK